MNPWLEFKITVAIKMSLQVYTEPSYITWANAWLDGSNRSFTTAYTAYTDATDAIDAAAADDAAAAAAYAYAYAATAADAYAAYAADYADKSIKYSIIAGAKLETVVSLK